MDKMKVISGKLPISDKEKLRLNEALELHQLVRAITAKGYDAEVKLFKDKLKVQKVTRSDSTIIDVD